MPQLKINLLGSPQIELNGTAVTIRRSKALALLIFLAGSGRPQRRDTLATLLWPDSKPAQARSSLRRELSILKKQIGATWFVIERETLGLHGDIWVDVAQFRHRLGGDSPTSLSDIDQLIEGVNLYDAGFLAGFHLENCAEFEEWQFFQAEALRHQYATGLDRLVRLLEERGDDETAVTYAQRRLSLDSLHEPAHRDLMRLYAKLGRQAAALRQYELCSQLLADELGIPPAIETAELAEHIRQNRLPQTPQRKINERVFPPLPVQATPFIGRETELQLLNRLMIAANNRLVTIIGTGGMGKTRLAVAFAEQQAADSQFANGVIFVPLASLGSAENIISALAEAMAFPLDRDDHQRPPKQQILDYLRQKQMLLVMDNFEHLLAGGNIINEILQTAPNIQILVTSRERLNLQGEQLVHLYGLNFPEMTVVEKETLSNYSAITLFIQTARRFQADFSLTVTDQIYLIELCQLIEGMPLAIELAASWVDTLSLADICAEIQNSLDLLATELKNIRERHRSMRAVFAYTWQQLNGDEQVVLAQLSIFRGGFTRPAAQMITGAKLPILSRLTRKSLLQFDRNANRYQIHELLRQYSGEQLRMNPEQETAARHKHSFHYLDALSSYKTRLKGSQQFTALAELEAELENTHLAWGWAVQHRHLERATSALPILCLFYELTVRYQEGEAICQAVLNILDSSEQTLLHVRGLTWQAHFYYLQGKSEQARQQLSKALDLLNGPALSEIDTRSERAAVLLALGQVGSLTIHHHDQVHYYEQSLSLYEALDDGWGMSKVLTALCWVVRHQVVVNTAAEWQAQIGRGEQFARRSVAICHQIGDQVGEALALVQVASFALYRGNYTEALSTIDESIALCERLGLKGVWVDAYVYRGMISASHGYYDQARAAIQAAYDMAQDLGYYQQLSNCLRVLGVIALAEGRYSEARRWSLSSVVTYRAAGHYHYLCVALAVLGSAEYQLGNMETARQHLVECLQLALQIHAYLLLWPILSLAAVLLLQRGQLIRAIEVGYLNLHFMDGAFPKFNEDTLTKFLAAATTDLPPEDVAAAQKRGQQLDLWTTVEALLAEFTVTP